MKQCASAIFLLHIDLLIMKCKLLCQSSSGKEKKPQRLILNCYMVLLLYNKNFFRRKIRPYDICDVCQEIQTIEHFLYDCSYVKPLWNVVDLVYETKVNFIHILGLDELFDHGSGATLISFLIYNE